MQIAEVHTPSLMMHQKDCTQHLVKLSTPGDNGTLIAMGPRLGKSVSTVEASFLTGKRRILVVSPVTIIDGWVEEVRKWWRGDDMPVQRAHGVTPTTIEGWTFTNYETLRERLEQVGPASYVLHWPTGYDAIVFDESVKVKSRTAKNTHAAECLAKMNRKKASIWLLSANPAPRDLSDLWTQLYIANPKKTPRSFWAFARTYCFVEETQWGPKITGNRPGAEEQLYADFGDTIWRPDPDRVPTLTPVKTEVREVPLTGEQLRMYLEMEAYFKALLNAAGDMILAPNVMVQGIRLMQLASNPLLVGGPSDAAKWRYMVDRIYEPGWKGPTLIWTAFKQTVESLTKVMSDVGFTVAGLTGSTNQKKRTEIRHQFQSGKIDLLFAHPGVGKFGLDLSAAQSVIWLEKSWPGDDYYQAGFRTRHLNKHSTVNSLELLAIANGQPTIDHAVHRLLHERTASTRRLTAADVKAAWTR